MKWRFAVLFTLTSFAALAADDQAKPEVKPLAPAAKPGIVVIDGKKFFPLTNVRRFTASGPSALQVMHHPRSPATLVSRRSTLNPSAAAASSSASQTPAIGGTPAAGTTTPSDVLSVFAPDDKSTPAAAGAMPLTK